MLSGKPYSVRLFVGSRFGYEERFYTRDRLEEEIQRFFARNEDARLSLLVYPLTFVAPGYAEPGWEITASLYPRYPLEPEDLAGRMRRLAFFLLRQLGQERVSLETPDEVFVIERADVQES